MDTDKPIRGRVVHWSGSGKFGFLRLDSGAADVFFHAEAFPGMPLIGTPVEFRCEPDPKNKDRRRAKNIVLLK